MANTVVDNAMDKFMSIDEIYHMSPWELDEFSERVNTRIDSFYMWALDTEADRIIEYVYDSKEYTNEE